MPPAATTTTASSSADRWGSVEKCISKFPTIPEMLQVFQIAERVLATPPSNATPAADAFRPNACYVPRQQLPTILSDLGLHVLALSDDFVSHSSIVAQMIHESHTTAALSDGQDAASAIHLKVLCDWLPTLQAAERCAPGMSTKAAKHALRAASAELEAIAKKLPTDRSPASNTARKKMFKEFDPNGNGMLSLAEIDKGLRDVVKLPEVFEVKPVIIRAFTAARKSVVATKENHNGDYVTHRTFRLLLLYVKRYFELWQLFVAADADGDRRLSKDEIATALPSLRRSGVLVLSDENVDVVFREMDRDSGGMVLFEEFSHWALSRLIASTATADGEDDDGGESGGDA